MIYSITKDIVRVPIVFLRHRPTRGIVPKCVFSRHRPRPCIAGCSPLIRMPSRCIGDIRSSRFFDEILLVILPELRPVCRQSLLAEGCWTCGVVGGRDLSDPNCDGAGEDQQAGARGVTAL